MIGRLKRKIFSRRRLIYYRLDLSANPGVGVESPRVERERYSQFLQAPIPHNSPRTSTAFRARVEKRSEQSNCCLYTIELDGLVAHWGWLTTFDRSHHLASVRRELEVDSPSAILLDFFTEASHRRQGLYEENLRKMLYDCATEGIRYTFIATRIDNLASRRVIEKVGFSPFRVYTKVRILGWTWVQLRAFDCATE